jgi:hypothetical protein
MRVAVACAATLCLAAATNAQEKSPDVPAGDASLSGRVVHDARQDAGAGVGVILYSLSPSGEPGLRQTRTDPQGAFRFEGISGDPEMVYLVGTRVGGVPFGTRVAFEAGEQQRQVEIQVSDPSRRAADVTSLEAQIRFQRGCSHLRVQHRHPLENETERVIFVPTEDREGAEPLLELLLPETATGIETPLGDALDGFDREGRRLRFWGPVYPGTSGVEFGYGVPLAPESVLRIGFPRGIEELRVFAPVAGPRVAGKTLHDEAERMLPTGMHRSWRSDAIDAGGELGLEVGLEDALQADALRVSEARIWTELDDAALDVSEQYELEVEGPEPLESPSGAPLLCVALPPDASALRFSNAALEMGLTRDPEGSLALHGPIPPGPSTLALRYQLPANPGTFRFERPFSREIPLLTLLVADTGLIAKGSRLHRRRPVRTGDRSYLHLEAFGIEAGETVSLDLVPVLQRRALPRLASSGFVLLAGLSALLFLVAPLRLPPEREDDEQDSEAPAISTERQAVYQALEALDDDFETGKLTEEDHDRMRGELRARAVALLRAERGSRPARDVAARACSSCGAVVAPEHRFCAQCGAPLAPERAG